MLYTEKNIILQIENLSIEYDSKVIIKDINIIEKDVVREGKIQGQCIAVVGRSGRGKSTLFKAMTGLISPTTGKVLIPANMDISNPSNLKAKYVEEGDVGFVDQKYTLFRHKTVYQTLFFALRKTKLSKQDKDEKINSYLNEWGLLQVKDQYPNELSGGQRQRTAIIEQLLSSGYYIVMDEPFSGLDVGNIDNVKKAFQLICSSHELNTVIFSTHDLELAVELADSVYVIGFPKKEDGSLANFGTVIKNFDLKKMGLAWSDKFTKDHLDVVSDIRNSMLES
jgi:ABC-type nitrate/sulfonate/bicarbonate transport system ATPase subunit